MNCPNCETSISKDDFAINVKEVAAVVSFKCSGCEKIFVVVLLEYEFKE